MLYSKYFTKVVTFNPPNNPKGRQCYYIHFEELEAKDFAQNHIPIKGAELEFEHRNPS